MRILTIDPGPKESAFCLLEGYKPILFDKCGNEALLSEILGPYQRLNEIDAAAIEMVASYGMAVGAEVFETCVWIGRFTQAINIASGIVPDRVFRMEEKQRLCHDSRARDSNIRQALIDRFAGHDKKNGKGTKNNPDWFYGFRADEWAAYAVGVVWLDRQQEAILKDRGTS